jgi:hypothetical protein
MTFTIRQLATNVSNFNISGNNVVWSGYDGNDYEIYLYDGSSTIQLTDNNSHGRSNPKISGNNLVWAGDDGTNSEISLYNGSSTIQLSDNNLLNRLGAIAFEVLDDKEPK